MDPNLSAQSPVSTSTNPSQDKKKLMIIAVVIILIVLGFILIFSFQTNQQNNKTGQTNSNSKTAAPLNSTSRSIPTPVPKELYYGRDTTGIYFATSKYYKNAYKIFPNPVPNFKADIDRLIDIKQTPLPDGSVQITLKTKLGIIELPQFIVKKGYSLYFVDDEYTIGGRIDDLGDGSYILVNENGYVVEN